MLSSLSLSQRTMHASKKRRSCSRLQTVLESLGLVGRQRALERALVEHVGERRRQDVAHRLAEKGLGRHEESFGVLDVTVEVHPIVAQDEHPVGNGAEDGAVSLLALAQRLLRPVMVDRGSGEVRGGLDEPELLAAGPARRVAVHRERAEHLLLRRQDRRRPAGAQPTRHGRVAQDVPLRVAADVGDDDRPSDLHHGAARADARADWLAVETSGVVLGKARRRAQPHMTAVRVEQQRPNTASPRTDPR